METAAAPVPEPLVSVVIPTHNRAELVVRAIRSVLGQTYRNLECIVVDDASTDNTADAVRAIQDPRLIYLRHEQSKHASATRNTGIAAAKGEFIAFLDDDDEWLAEKLQAQISVFSTESSEVGMVYCWADYYDLEKCVYQRHPTLRGNIFPFVLDEQRIGNCSTLLLRESIVRQIGGFDEALPRGNDGDFIRRVSLKCMVEVVCRVLVKVHVDHGFSRITSRDAASIRRAVFSQEDKLRKFKDELPRYPKQTANIYAQLGQHYAELGDWKRCLARHWQALCLTPMAYKPYTSLLRSARALLYSERQRSGVPQG